MKKIRVIARQFVNFGFVGVINTILNLAIYWFCINNGMHYLLANGIGFVITVFSSYILNNLVTFRKKGKGFEWSIKTLLKVYVSYFLTGMILNSVLLYFWNDFIGISENISPLLNLIVTIPLNFLMNKLWAYGDNAQSNP